VRAIGPLPRKFRHDSTGFRALPSPPATGRGGGRGFAPFDRSQAAWLDGSWGAGRRGALAEGSGPASSRPPPVVPPGLPGASRGLTPRAASRAGASPRGWGEEVGARRLDGERRLGTPRPYGERRLAKASADLTVGCRLARGDRSASGGSGRRDRTGSGGWLKPAPTLPWGAAWHGATVRGATATWAA